MPRTQIKMPLAVMARMRPTSNATRVSQLRPDTTRSKTWIMKIGYDSIKMLTSELKPKAKIKCGLQALKARARRRPFAECGFCRL